MNRLLTRLDNFGRLAENTALVVLLTAMMLLAVGQIVLREFFDSGFVWADELVKLLILWLAMIGSIAASRDDRHIRIDALSHVLPDSVVKVTRILVDIFAAAVCGVLAWYAYRWTLIEIEFAETVLIDTPKWIAHIVLPASFAIISYRFIVGVIMQIAGVDEGDVAGEKD